MEPGTGSPARPIAVIGWDIGGVNTKVARVSNGALRAALGRPFELQHAPDTLPRILRELAAETGVESGDVHAVTMTAELSQTFRTKREGVASVLDAVETAFPGAAVRVFTVRGDFIRPDEARHDPLSVAAANWSATARLVARYHADALLIDTGTTTTDVIPIVGGCVVAAGLTDPDRLASGELVYTGVLRTPVEAIAFHVPFRGRPAGISAEGFALAGDVHLWRGDLAPGDYTVPTPDRRPATREFAAERLARAVCADREVIDEAGITAIADALAHAQIARVVRAIRQVRARHPGLKTAVVTGVGAFLGRAAAQAAGLEVIPLADDLGADGARCAPAACVALLLDAASRPTTVVKVGGSLLAHREHLAVATAAISELARHRSLVVVPGGGPFVDAVRDVDARIGLSDDAAHWMAILGMDQHAHLLAEQIRDSMIAAGPAEIRAALASGRVPVLAPSTWLRTADPLPHSWDITSDSIAAWVAGQLGAERLVLLKPPSASGPDLVDRHFAAAVPPNVSVTIAALDELAHLSLT